MAKFARVSGARGLVALGACFSSWAGAYRHPLMETPLGHRATPARRRPSRRTHGQSPRVHFGSGRHRGSSRAPALLVGDVRPLVMGRVEGRPPGNDVPATLGSAKHL